MVIERLGKEGLNVKSQLKTWILFGLSIFLISTAKSSAIVAIPAVLLFFALEKLEGDGFGFRELSGI